MTPQTREKLLEREIDELTVERDYLRHLLDGVYRAVQARNEDRVPLMDGAERSDLPR